MNLHSLHRVSRKYGISLMLIWTCLLLGGAGYVSREFHANMISLATGEARDYYKLNLHYRRWVSNIGGVYAFRSKIESNPHLLVPDRDVKTESGTPLTLVNPAYMARMVFEAVRNDYEHPVISRLVSLNPINPVNTPNAWEVETLKTFESGPTRERFQLLTIENRPYLQFMAAFITEEGCLKCHAMQGYKAGDIRGGMSIAIPISGYLAMESERNKSLASIFVILWGTGIAGITVTSRRRFQYEERLEEERKQLEDEINERLQTQEQLEHQAILLEEEAAERQKVVDALTRTENFLQTIIDTEPECVKLIDADCRLLYMNRAGLKMIESANADEVKGQDILPLICEPYREKFREINRQVFLGDSKIGEFEIVGLKGRRLWMHSTMVPFRDESGDIVAALAITRDITELKHTVKELQKKSCDIEQFIRATSHGLSTPLETVKSFLGFLENDVAAGDQVRVAHDLQLIHGAADRMKQLLDEMLVLSRSEMTESRMELFSLNNILDDVLNSSLELIIRKHHVEITRPDEELVLFGDRSQIHKIWLNLIDNAIKFRRENYRPHIELGIQKTAIETIFFVKDNGIGIAPDYCNRIFNLLEKHSATGPVPGRGLAMIQRIVETCGGRIWVESAGPGHGSTFYFTLPFCLAVE